MPKRKDLGPSDVHVAGTQLVYLQLETNHNNRDGVAWYAYFTGECDYEQVLRAVGSDKQEDAPLGFESFEGVPYEEACTPLSEHAGLRRFCVGMGV